MGVDGSIMPRLRVSRAQADSDIHARLDNGQQLLKRLGVWGDVRSLEDDFHKWDSYNKTLLRKLFDTVEVSEEEYNPHIPIHFIGPQTQTEMMNEMRDDLRRCIRDLDIILAKLPLYDELAPSVTPSSDPMPLRDANSRSVFVVHGRGDGLRESVARLLSNLGLDPIILCEQTNTGRTIIEKFEDHADVGYAVVLLVPDDEGRLATSDTPPSPRARQNVIFELGYFMGRLGRKRVCVIVEEGVEVPSDIAGLGYVSRDPMSHWKYQLTSELKSAGYAVTLDNVR